MTQLVFLHGPGAGGCAQAYRYQTAHFRDSLAPDLPGRFGATACGNVERYTEWVRGWLSARRHHTPVANCARDPGVSSLIPTPSPGGGRERRVPADAGSYMESHKRDLVLVGFTLGSLIGLQYGLDYPDEIKGLVLMTAAMRPKGVKPDIFANRLRAAEDPATFEGWLDTMRQAMGFVDPVFREELIDWHRKIGPKSQHDDLVVMESFDVRDRIATLKPKLLLIHGTDRHVAPGDFEEEIHQAVPGSKILAIPKSGHFPMAEHPDIVNRAIEEFVATLG